MGFIKKTLGKSILLTIGILVSLVVIELYLRLEHPFGFRLKGNKILLETNISKIFKLKVNEKLDNEVLVKKNSLGFRGDDPPNDLSNWISIVANGGSTTECIVLTEGDTWMDKLGIKLKHNFNKVWVNNAGIDGLSSFGSNVMLSDYLVPLKPKYLIFLVGVNDVALDKSRSYDLFKKKEIQGINLWLSEKSELWSSIYNFYRLQKTKQAGLSSTKIVNFNILPMKIDSGENYPDYKVLGTTTCVDCPVKQEEIFSDNGLLKRYYERLKKIIEESKKNNIKPILVTQPAVYGNGIDNTTGVDLEKIIIETSNGEWGEGISGKEKWKILEKYNDVTRKIGLDQNITVIDLAKKMPKDTKYYYDFIHFSKAGAEKVSEILYEDICPYIQKDNKNLVIHSCGDR